MRQMKKRWQRKAKVDEAVNNAKASIDQVTNNEGVDTAKSNGLDSLTISNQRLLRKTKQNAIDKAAEAKNGNRSNTNATDEEKASEKLKLMKQ